MLLLEGEHAVLLDRSRYRRYDPATGKVYHMPGDNDDALSPPIQPERPDGNLDAEVVARCVVLCRVTGRAGRGGGGGAGALAGKGVWGKEVPST